MEKSLLYPDCDFSIWFRSVNENNTTEKPIEGRKIGKKLNILLVLLSLKKELFLIGSMVVCIKMGLVFLM
jgi:hypothetical protein